MLADLLLIMADDLSPELLAAAHTPNLDALASISTTFTQHHGGAACSASRASLLTGKYCFQHKVGSIFNQNKDTGWSLEITNPLTLLPALVPGSSILIGKHHLNSDTFPDHAITVCGYDDFVGTTGNLGKPDGYYDFEFYDNGQKYNNTDYATEFFCIEAEEAIQANFGFVHLALHAAHDPLHWPPAGTYQSTDQRTAIVEAMDYYLGPVIEAALARDMRIVFTSDNGGDKDVGGKGNLMSAALRVPLLIHDPELCGSGSVVSDITDWTSLRYWIQSGTVAFPSVINIDRFKGVEYVDWSTYEEAVITQNHKLIIHADDTSTLYDMPEETVSDNHAMAARLYRMKLNNK